MNPSARKYLQQVRGWIPCGGKMKQRTMVRIEDNLDHFLEEKPHADYQAIVARFGTPQQIATSYVDEMDVSELLNNLRIKKRIMRIVSITAAVVVALWIGVVSIAYINCMRTADGDITTTIDVYEEFVIDEGT